MMPPQRRRIRSGYRKRAGQTDTAESGRQIAAEAPVTVYNFEVGDFHTYYVSTFAVLVHNLCTVEAVDFTKISTVSTTPNNLTEKLAMESAKSNPFAGISYPLIGTNLKTEF